MLFFNHCGNNKVLRQTTLSKEYIRPLFKSAHEDNIHIHTYTDDYVICEEDRGRNTLGTKVEIKVPALIVDSVYDYIDFNPVEIILLDLNNQQRLMRFPRKKCCLSQKAKWKHFFQALSILEYCPLGVSKGNAVVELCKLLNVPIENTIAAGDAENDIPLLKAASQSAVVCKTVLNQLKLLPTILLHLIIMIAVLLKYLKNLSCNCKQRQSVWNLIIYVFNYKCANIEKCTKTISFYCKRNTLNIESHNLRNSRRMFLKLWEHIVRSNPQTSAI